MMSNILRYEYSAIIGNDETLFDSANREDAIGEFLRYCESIKDNEIPEEYIVDLIEYVYIDYKDASDRLEDVIENFLIYRYDIKNNTEIFFSTDFNEKLKNLLKENIEFRKDRKWTNKYLNKNIVISYNLFDRELV
jgi:hypothetical protein